MSNDDTRRLEKTTPKEGFENARNNSECTK